MKKRNDFRLLIVVNAVMLILLVLNFLYTYKSKHRIAYVNSTELVYGFNGMKEANQRLTNETAQYKNAIDSIEQAFAIIVEDYKAKQGTMSESERLNQEKNLNDIYQRNENYKARIQEIIDKKDQELTQGVLSQINSYIEEYGKAHGYDIIFGTGNGGLVLYGDDAIDITQELLLEMNESYYPEAGNTSQDSTNE